MSTFGVTANGFNRKRVEDIRTELQADFKLVFGADIDVSEDSNFGAIIDMLTKKFATLWEGQEETYNSRDVNGATGISLDRLCAMVGVTRKGITASTVQCRLFGDNGTVLPVGRIVSQEDTNEEFTLNAETTISASTAISAVFEVDTVTDSVSYTVTINGNNYTINSGVGATAESIIAALKVDIDTAAVEPVIFTDNLDGTAIITSSDSSTAFTISVSALMALAQISVLGQFTASTLGAISVPSETIVTIGTAVTGWDSVINLQAGVTGADEETDEELRIRRVISLVGAGAGTDTAIQANLLNNVEGVTTVRVISNRTNGTVDARPAKSFECIVTGGSDQEVAEEIWLVQPSGIESYGTTTVVIVDSNGDNQTIKFSRPADKYLWVRYTLELYTEEELTSNVEFVIREAVVAYAAVEYQAGVDVILDRLCQPVYQSVKGIGNMVIETTVTALPTDTPSYGTSNISITDREIAVITTTRVTVLIP